MVTKLVIVTVVTVVKVTSNSDGSDGIDGINGSDGIFQSKQLDTSTTDEMFSGQRFAILVKLFNYTSQSIITSGNIYL